MNPPAKVVHLNDVAPERVSWLWPGRLPLGKLVVLDGDPSVGKSTLTLDLAARVTTGTAWPDGATNTEAAHVLLLSAEDGLADTIAPRLLTAGADPSRVHALTEVKVTDGEVERMVPPSLPRDLPIIEQVIVAHQVRLVVIDVLMAFLSSSVDSHRDQDARGVLHQIAAIAERCGCVVVMIRHLTKGGGSHALYRGGGSIGIIGAARAGFIVGRDPDDDERLIFASLKSNLAPLAPSLAYRLVSDPTYGCARVTWETDPVSATANDLLQIPDSETRTAMSEAAGWLVDYLESCGGVCDRKTIVNEGRKAGHSEASLKRAMSRAGIVVENRGFPRCTFWSIPDLQPQSVQSEQASEPEPTEPTAFSPQSVQSAQQPEPTGCLACGGPMTANDGGTTHPTCASDLELGETA